MAGGHSSPPSEQRRGHETTRNDTLAHAQCKFGGSAGLQFGAELRARRATGRQAPVRTKACAQGSRASRGFGELCRDGTVRITPNASVVGVSSVLRRLYLEFVVSLGFCVILHNGGRQT